ncbi:MAG: phage major capsid protein [Candidatus Neomarinimicrobiota bacterium]
MLDLKDLLNQRGKAIRDARAIVDLADAEKRNMTEEEETRYNQFMDEARDLKKKIDRETELREEERQAAESTAAALEQRGELGRSHPNTPDEQRAEKLIKEFRSYLLTGRIPAGATELRSYQADSDQYGGFIVTPPEFSTELIKDVDNAVFIRKLAHKFQLKTSASLGAPSLDSRMTGFTWGTEVKTITEDTGMTFGNRSFEPHPATLLVKVSEKLLRVGALPVEQIVRQEIAYTRGINEEAAFMTGNGDKRPLGVFIASNDGIPTSRDVSTGNTTTEIRVDGLKAAKYALKMQYRQKAQWIFHRDAVAMIAKLKDGNGQYLWQESTKEGEPDRLLGFPVNESEYAPYTFTTGLYAGILGDFYHYGVVDALDIQIQRLLELFALNSQVGFIARFEVDGAPLKSEAFVRVKLA